MVESNKKDINSVLINYIWTYLKQGYSLDAIKKRLISENFQLQDINYAVDYIYANYYHSTSPNSDFKKHSNFYKAKESISHMHAGEILIFILIIFGVSLIGFALVFILGDSNSQVVDTSNVKELNFEDSKQEIIPGENVPDEKEVVSSTNSQELDPAEEEIKDPVTEISEREDIVSDSIDTSSNSQEFVGEGFNPGKHYTRRQIELKVDYFSKSDPREAIKFCSVLSSDVDVSFCYIDVAVNSGVVDYCEQIIDNSIKDDCYLRFAIEGLTDSGICSSIYDSYKKGNCERLIELNVEMDSVSSAVVENDPAEAINAISVTADFY